MYHSCFIYIQLHLLSNDEIYFLKFFIFCFLRCYFKFLCNLVVLYLLLQYCPTEEGHFTIFQHVFLHERQNWKYDQRSTIFFFGLWCSMWPNLFVIPLKNKDESSRGQYESYNSTLWNMRDQVCVSKTHMHTPKYNIVYINS